MKTLVQGYHVEEKPAVNPFCHVTKVYILISAAMEFITEFVCHNSEHELRVVCFFYPLSHEGAR